MINQTDLKVLCKNTVEKLFTMHNNDIKNNLVFPYYSNKGKEKMRVSEQEARFIFCQELENKREYYAVEVPTHHRYGEFSSNIPQIYLDNEATIGKNGKSVTNGKSASIDLCIFEEIPNNNNPIPNRINVEFKAHNVEQNHITKDFLKLLAEDGNGLFFHLLESVDSNTLNIGYSDNNKKGSDEGVLTKYYNAVKNIINKNLLDKLEKSKESIIIFVCSLKPKFILYQEIKKANIYNTDFNIEYEIIHKDKDNPRGIKFIEKNNWETLEL